jgi:predicted RNA binding protein YcfA (HicA-like mRNA interferase family)
MRRLQPLSGHDLVAKLERAGFRVVRRKGSHMILRREAAPALTICVPDHKELKRETLANILRCARLTREELEALDQSPGERG